MWNDHIFHRIMFSACFRLSHFLGMLLLSNVYSVVIGNFHLQRRTSEGPLVGKGQFQLTRHFSTEL